MAKSKSDNGDFFNQVYQVTRLIPFGRVTSYGAIANYLGTSRSSRMVGWALNQSTSQSPFVPAHRVVNRFGMLSGRHHFPSPDMMQELLENEDVKVDNDQVVNFKELFWNPATELL